MAHFLLLLCSFERLFASVLPSPRELSSQSILFSWSEKENQCEQFLLLVGDRGWLMHAIPATEEICSKMSLLRKITPTA
jgi:hypothetical protein